MFRHECCLCEVCVREGLPRPWSAHNAAKVSLNSVNSSLLHILSVLSPSRAGGGCWEFCALIVDAVFGVGGSAPLCEACSSDIHQTTSARHNIKTIVSELAHTVIDTI